MNVSKKDKRKMLTANIVKDQVDGEMSFTEWFLYKLDILFVENIPLESIKELQPIYMYIFGFISYILAMGCFAYFAYNGYKAARTKEYVAVDKAGGECQEIPKSVSGSWLASQSGLYEGEVEFAYPEAMYMLEFTSLSKTKKEYMALMDEYEDHLNVLAEQSYQNDLAANILLWVTWQVFKKEKTGMTRFQMNADPRSVFDNEFTFGQMSTVDAECYVPSSVSSFDRANGVFTNTYSYAEFISTPNCSGIDPVMFGYRERFFGDQFILEMDVNTAITAIGVNKGILDINNLEPIVEQNHNQNGVTMTKRIDNRLPEMTPMYCVDDVGICLMKFGKIIGMPVYNHFGTLKVPKPCSCGPNFDPYCNTFDFMIGFLYYSYNTSDTTGESLARSVQRIIALLNIRPFSETNAMAFNVSWAATASASYPVIYTYEWRHDAFAFCYIDGVYCDVVMFNSFDFENHFVSSYYFNIERGACNNTFTIDNWKQLRDNPPTSLVEEYFTCVANVMDAFFLTIGIAAGNTATMVPIVLLCTLPFLYLYLQVTGKTPLKPEYEAEELTDTSNALSLIILRVRDGKMRGIKKRGYIVHLTNELLQSAVANSGEIDSDDESDEEEDRPDASKVATMSIRSSTSGPDSSSADMATTSSWLSGMFTTNAARKGETTSNPLNTRDASLELTGMYSKIYILNAVKDMFAGSRQNKSLGAEATVALITKLHEALEKAETVRNVDGGARVLDNARKMSMELRDVNLLQLDEFYITSTRQARKAFQQLHSCMSVHASLELQCALEVIEHSYVNRIFYIVGSTVLSLANVKKLSSEDNHVEPSSLGTDEAEISKLSC